MSRFILVITSILFFGGGSAWAGQKVCLTITLTSSDIPGVTSDRERYRQIAKNNDCRPIEITKEFFETNSPKEKAIAKLKEMIGDSQEILMMYSGHGICVGGEKMEPPAKGNTRASYRLAPAIDAKKKPINFDQVAKYGPSTFGFDLGNHNACRFRCSGEGYEACERACDLKETFHTEDMKELFQGKDLTALIDACGSGCFTNELLGAKSFNVMSSAKYHESTIDTPEGGILNLRLQQAVEQGELCYMDSDQNGSISYVEMNRYFSNGANSTVSKTYEKEELVRGVQAVFPKSSGGVSGFNLFPVSAGASCGKSSGRTGGGSLPRGAGMGTQK